jgi:uncharacterized membrane protein
MLDAINLGLAFFACVFVLHICLWRFLKPKNEIKSILLIFVIIPFFLFSVFYVFTEIRENSQSFFYGALLFFSLSVAYIVTFPAIAIEIPTLKIIRLMEESAALNEDELVKKFDKESLLGSRKNLLEADSLITYSEGKLKLSFFGSLIARSFIAYRRILGMKIGDG